MKFYKYVLTLLVPLIVLAAVSGCSGKPSDNPEPTESKTTAASTADKAVAEQAVGELLFTAAALARQAGVDPEQALQKRNAAFLAEHTGRAENQES